MTSAKQIDALARAMLSGVKWIRTTADDPRVKSGELISDRQVHEMTVSALRRLFNEVESALSEAAHECVGKTRSQISAIMKRKLGGAKANFMRVTI